MSSSKSADQRETVASRRPRWYAGGLHFSCTRCGHCCSGSPGVIHFTRAELSSMASILGVSRADFLRSYATRHRGRWTLRELRTEQGHDCVLLRRDARGGGALCLVYEARPSQCRTWPFWASNLKTRKAWEDAAESCPGMRASPGSAGSYHDEARIHAIRGRKSLRQADKRAKYAGSIDGSRR